MDNIRLVENAQIFAHAAHGAIGQRRKYTHGPYIGHPAAVAALAEEAGMSSATIAAAWLHDVVEDTEISAGDIERWFGPDVAQLVLEVTDVSRPEDGNRATRKEIDRMHLAKSSYEGASIKLADLIDNTSSIVENDPSFAKIYLQEKRELLDVLGHGNPMLLDRAKRVLGEAEERLMATESK